MSEPTQPDAGAPAAEPIAPSPEPSSTPPPPSDAPITAREAAGLIAEQASEPPSGESRDTAPPKEPRSETEAQEPPQEPLKPPRSWPKAEQEAFASLTPQHQEALLARERAREADIQLGLKQAAEQRKAAEALAQQAEQTRQTYEQNLPAKALLIDAQYRQEFGTPTWDQIQDWAANDPPKWVRWNAAYQRATAVAGELKAQQAQQQQQQQQEFEAFIKNAEAWKTQQTEIFHEKAPEWKDPATYQAKVVEVLDYLQEVGFKKDEVERLAGEFVPLQMHDYRLQLIIRDALRYREAAKAAKNPVRKPVPPVQRPGSAPNRGEANEARFRDLNTRLDRSGDARDAARLIAAMNGR